MGKDVKIKFLLVVLLVSICASLGAVGAYGKQTDETVFWHLDQVNDVAFEISSENGVFLYFTMLGCLYCQIFEENAFSELRQELQEYRLPMVIIAQGETSNVLEKYGIFDVPLYMATTKYLDSAEIRGFPTFQLLSLEQGIVWEQLGFRDDGDISMFNSLWEHVD